MKKITTFGVILIGATIGGGLRYLISLIMVTSDRFPWGTLFVNLTGSLILPLLIHYLHDRYHLSAITILSLTAGLLGSYTTFSTMTADTYRLFISGNYLQLSIYLGLTIVGSFLLAILGNYLAVVFASRRINN